MKSLAAFLFLLSCATPLSAQSDWVRDGLIGPVRRVHTSRLETDGRATLLSVAVYNREGRKLQEQVFAAAGQDGRVTGDEVRRYNERGDLAEVDLLEPGATRVVERRRYEYAYDPVGNWTRRAVGPAKEGAGREVLTRLVIYYLTAQIARAVGYESLDARSGAGAFFFPPDSKYPPRVFEPMFKGQRVAKRQRARWCFYRHGGHYHRRRCRPAQRGRAMPQNELSQGIGVHDGHHHVMIASLHMPTALAPTVSVRLIEPERHARRRQALVQILIDGLEIVDPIEVNEVPREGQGHVHLQVDDGPILAVPSLRMRLRRLTRGGHTFRVMLHANDHTPLGAQAETSLRVP